MKNKLQGFIIGLFAICSFNAKAQTNITYGTWQAFAIALNKTTYPEINGRLFKMSWKDIETAPNVWRWFFNFKNKWKKWIKKPLASTRGCSGGLPERCLRRRSDLS